MAEDSDLEKTESASPQRLEKAREEGQVARSIDLSTFSILLVASGGLWMMGSGLVLKLADIMKAGLQLDQAMIFDVTRMLSYLNQQANDGLVALLPLMLLLLVTALVAPMLLNGWNFSIKALQPDFNRLNPVNGLGRIFSMHGLTELIKAIVKTGVIGGVATWMIWRDKEVMLSLIGMTVDAGITRTGKLLGFDFFMIVGAMILIVAIDVPFQLWEHARKLRMTKEEVRQESKESEGDPHTKSRIRGLQREAARKRMMAEIPKADVIVTNPTHYAIALRYQSETMRAPKVVAKGSHLLAARIREVGEEHHIPILESPPLARALYHHAGLDTEIPEVLYTAVAEILAYIFQLKRYQEYGGDAPQLPTEITVPEGLDPGPQE